MHMVIVTSLLVSLFIAIFIKGMKTRQLGQRWLGKEKELKKSLKQYAETSQLEFHDRSVSLAQKGLSYLAVAEDIQGRGALKSFMGDPRFEEMHRRKQLLYLGRAARKLEQARRRFEIERYIILV